MNSTFIYFILALTACAGCGQKYDTTPKEFLSMVTAEAAIYSRDSAAVVADLSGKMKRHEASFTNPEYYDSTVLIIDSILYDPSLNKIGVFVIAKNPTYRNPHSDSKEPYYYNANCYLGKRINVDSSGFELNQLGPFSSINFDNIQEIRQSIRDDYFLELATVLDENKQPVFKYNLNDKRFWDSETGWRRMFK